MPPRPDGPVWIDDDAPLPPASAAMDDDSAAPGLVAAGGRITLERLEEAYRGGLFPWYSAGQPVLWWSPDPRMVLEPARFKVSRSLRKTLRRFVAAPGCAVRIDTAFDRVVAACAGTPREGQDGTWIVPEMQRGYARWHRAGRVHSVETWMDGELAGGLYCIGIGRMVYGESMFSHRTDASKIALAALVAFCLRHGVPLIDCQQNTRHLASLGGHEIPRERFLRHLRVAVQAPGIGRWTYDDSMWRELGLAPGAADPDGAGPPSPADPDAPA